MRNHAALKPHRFYIMLALAGEDRHGLAIAREVTTLSAGAVTLWPARLYGSLDELRDERLIEEVSEPPHGESERRRYYRLTRRGRAALSEEADRLARLARLARSRTRTGEA